MRPGLYTNIAAKRKRIAEGGAERVGNRRIAEGGAERLLNMRQA